jgi:tetratricopeptide (TPR) repeat protein
MKIFGFSFAGSSQKELMSELNEYYRIAEEHPDDTRVHLRIAEVLMKMGNKGKAIEEYIYAAEGYEANNLSQISAAIYKQILQIDPGQINVYQTLVDVHLKEGFLGDAIAAYERLACYYYNRGMKDDAMKTLEKMSGLDPNSVYIKKKIDRFCSERKIEPRAGETKSTGEDWELLDPVTSGREYDQRTLKQKRGEFYDLEAELKDDFLTDEDAAQGLEDIGDSDDTSKVSFDEIFKEIQQSESESPEQNDSLFHFNLGTAFQKVGRYDEAIDEIKKALEDPKRSADCYLRLAICNKEKNLIGAAIKYLKKGLHSEDLLESKMLELKYELALAYNKKGKGKKALKLFKEIHEVNSTFREVENKLYEASK